MPKKAGSSVHHCPGAKGKGNCRRGETAVHKHVYCSEHQNYCRVCPEEYHFMKKEGCIRCEARKQSEKEKKAAEEAATKQTKKDPQEKKKQQQKKKK